MSISYEIKAECAILFSAAYQMGNFLILVIRDAFLHLRQWSHSILKLKSKTS